MTRLAHWRTGGSASWLALYYSSEGIQPGHLPQAPSLCVGVAGSSRRWVPAGEAWCREQTGVMVGEGHVAVVGLRQKD